MDGIGWFTYESFKRICRNHPEHEFHFLFDRPYSEKFIFSDNIIPHIVRPQARHPLLFKIWYDYTVPRLLKKIAADVFISPDAVMSLTTSVPQLVVLHDLNFVHYPNDLEKKWSVFLNARTRKFAEKAARIATVSEFSKSDIIHQFAVPESKVDVVYNGVNEDFHTISKEEIQQVRNRISDGKPYFVFVGSAYPRKNLQRLLPAFDAFKEKSASDVKLVIVGKKFRDYSVVDEAFTKMKHSGDVVLTGMLDADELHRVVASSLASVYVSYFEGFGIPILEAFSCDVPVITSSLTAMPEVAGDAALLINPFSEDEIAQAMLRILEDTALRKELIAKGRERLKLFSWEQTAEKLWASIEKIL